MALPVCVFTKRNLKKNDWIQKKKEFYFQPIRIQLFSLHFTSLLVSEIQTQLLKLTSSRSAPFSTAIPSTAWYRIWKPVSPVCSRPCHDTSTDFVWMSWMATFRISGWLQKNCGSSWAKIIPCSSRGCSQRRCGVRVAAGDFAPPDGVVVCADEGPLLAGAVLEVVSSERVHLEWSPSHCQSSWESQVQFKGLSVGRHEHVFIVENYRCLKNGNKQILTRLGEFCSLIKLCTPKTPDLHSPKLLAF